MKVTFIVGQFPALSETFILNQITGLIDRGHEICIYAGSKPKSQKVHPDVEKYNLLERTFYGIPAPQNKSLRILKGFWLLATSCLKNPLVILRLLEIIKYRRQVANLKFIYFLIPLLHKRLSADIIHCHFGENGTRGALLRRIGIYQGKLVTTFHGKDITTCLQSKGDRYYEYLLSTGDIFLPISKLWERKLIEIGCNKRKIMVHHMGVDCKNFSFIRRQLCTDRPVHLVTVARLVEKKGVEYAVRAVSRLSKVNGNIRYSIVGDGPLREDLEGLIQKLGIGDVVKLLGWKQQQEVLEILDSADILLAPSVTSKDGDQEGIPVSLMEAMAMGLPVISTQHSGIPELVHDGVSGFLVPERDVDALFEKLSYLVERPNIWSEMGCAGRLHVEQYYNNDRLCDHLVEIYQNILRSNDLDDSPTVRTLSCS